MKVPRRKILLYVFAVAACAAFNQFYTVALQPTISTHAAVAQLNGGDAESLNVRSIQYSHEYLYALELTVLVVLLIVIFWPALTSYMKDKKHENSH